MINDKSGGYAPPFAALAAWSFGYGERNLSLGRPGRVNISPSSLGPSFISNCAAIAFNSSWLYPKAARFLYDTNLIP